MLTPAPAILDHVVRPTGDGGWPQALDGVLSAAMADAAQREITDWPNYAPTPMHRLDVLARQLGVADIAYKDESTRFGLGSFKALGGAYAVLRLAAQHVAEKEEASPPLRRIREGAFRHALSSLTVTTATDGNHGRSVAWGATMAGCRSRIYVHAGVSQGRRNAMAALGAEIVRIDGDYDDSVRRCAEDAAANGWFVVSDTSYDGYMEVPRDVMAGYSVMASEALDQTAGRHPTHVFIQGGVGGLAAAVLARFWQVLGPDRPRFVVVEPSRAACLTATARQGRPTVVAIEEETVMAGLSCGTVSLLAWDVLKQGAGDYLTVGDEAVAPAMRMLAKGEAGGGPVVAGESGVAGLVGLLGVAADPGLRRAIGLDSDSRVLLFGSEGATDPDIYRALVDGAAA